MSGNHVVLDTSVVAKWFFPEEGSAKALKVKDDFAKSSLTISVPVLIFYELNNLLKTSVKMLRIKEESASSAYRAFLNLNLAAYSSKELLEKTLSLAIKYNISSYDASYIALAELLEAPLLTADQRLVNKVQSKLVINLDNY